MVGRHRGQVSRPDRCGKKRNKAGVGLAFRLDGLEVGCKVK